ncbi:MAG: hypothetical protein JF603_03465 [Acidobacteria bacterium]|nr:hypothetical protein [Acidobacteriota bacterium]
MAEVPEHDHKVDTGKSVLSLEELGHIQPGMAEIMPLIGVRIWKCFYAGKARNRELAKFQLKEAINLMEKGVLLRPKYTDNMYKFIEEECAVLGKLIDSEDWDGFEAAFDNMVSAANAYHEVYDKGFLVWKVPSEAPGDMDFTPRKR